MKGIDRELTCLLDIDPDQLNKYSFHSAILNSKNNRHPLDDYIRDIGDGNIVVQDGEIVKIKEKSLWLSWNTWYPNINRWGGRPYLLTFMQFRPEWNDVWLFGGIFKVTLNIPEEVYLK